MSCVVATKSVYSNSGLLDWKAYKMYYCTYMNMYMHIYRCIFVALVRWAGIDDATSILRNRSQVFFLIDPVDQSFDQFHRLIWVLTIFILWLDQVDCGNFLFRFHPDWCTLYYHLSNTTCNTSHWATIMWWHQRSKTAFVDSGRSPDASVLVDAIFKNDCC